jgi:gamma-glutamylcyclotransferase (GGCT)/AIG2-like uncharacterized protein YtfP
VLLFLYGTLLDPRVLARQSGEPGLARRLRPARLGGYARAGLRGTLYPTLVPRPGAWTRGAVLRAGPAARRRLAEYEGPQYRLVPVRVETRRGPVRRGPGWRHAGGRRWSRGGALPLVAMSPSMWKARRSRS